MGIHLIGLDNPLARSRIEKLIVEYSKHTRTKGAEKPNKTESASDEAQTPAAKDQTNLDDYDIVGVPLYDMSGRIYHINGNSPSGRKLIGDLTPELDHLAEVGQESVIIKDGEVIPHKIHISHKSNID